MTRQSYSPPAGTGIFAPLVSPALTGTPTVNGATIEDRTHAAANLAPLSHLTATDPHADRAYADTQRGLLAADPLGVGPVCFLPGTSLSVQTWATANDARFVRLLGGGTISKVGFQVGAASGNVSVAAYSGSGSGRNRVPGTRLATSGTVACPATGYQEVSLGASITVAAGDFLALSCDNTTATFAATNASTNSLYAGMMLGQATAHPLPSVPSTFPTGAKVPLLTGSA